MNEVIITLDSIDLRDLCGAGDVNLLRINSKFPTLKVIVRGNAMKIVGPQGKILQYQNKLNELIDYFHRYGHISPEVIDRLYDSIELGSAKNNEVLLEPVDTQKDVLVYGVSGNLIKAKTKNQVKLVEAFVKNDLVFAIGPAGSGKTYTAIALAVRTLKNREVKRIILTRPAVEAGEKLGFLPGDMKEKLDPYLQPLYDALGDMIPSKKLSEMMDEGVVQIAPLAYMRGRTLDNACVILDEAQNTTNEQLKMFLTRMGRTAKFIVTGDLTQIDLPSHTVSGLKIAIENLEGVKGISIIKFDATDNLRHPLVGKIVGAYKDK